MRPRGSAKLALALSLLLAACGATQRPDGGKGLLPEGSPTPSVTAVDQDGKTRSIAAEKGRFVVVYFYPRDATPGCTKEACAFRDVWKKYEAAGVLVFGVSSDDQASHKKFADEHKLTFPLLADTDGAWARGFGVGSTLGMYQRVTFVVGDDGRVRKVYPEVDPGVHAEQVLSDIAAMKK